MSTKVLRLSKCLRLTTCSLTVAKRSLKTKVTTADGVRVRVRSSGKPWLSTIGLEVHAQLKTETKLFSRSPAGSGGPVNSKVSLFDASIPGTLPVLNKKCVELATKAALGLNCNVNLTSTFDRKHYFYADLPAGYQITQQRRPIATKGHLDFQVLKSSTVPDTYSSSVGIIQVQLEQDSGKSLHDLERNITLVDLNRCGSGLIEIVFGPDLFHGEEAASLIKELILILKRLDVCSCQMEDGALRVDANVSVRKLGDETLGVRTEVKNINSVRGVVNAIEAEVDRQIDILESGGTITNETRTYDATIKKSVPMRDKEVRQDYRFLPEPNLPPLRLDEDQIANFKSSMPEMPAETRTILMEKYNLRLESAVRLVNEPVLHELFVEAAKFDPGNYQILANVLCDNVEPLASKHFIDIDDLKINPKHFARMTKIKVDGELTHSLILRLLESLVKNEVSHDDIDEHVKAQGWKEVFRNEAVIRDLVDQVIEENSKTVKKFVKSQKPKLLTELVQAVLAKNDILDPVLVKGFLEKALLKKK